MAPKHKSKRSSPSSDSQSAESGKEYKVGPGRPPKEYQFAPGESGNPKGRKPKPQSLVPDLKRLVEQELAAKVTIKQGEKTPILTKAAIGIQQMMNQFAKGDRNARRDVIAIADKLGVNLLGEDKALQEALAPNHQEILRAYVRSQYDQIVLPAPVFAPPELTDDDPEDGDRS